MELKKSPEVNLEEKKLYYLLVGLMLALALVLVAFEWTEDQGDKRSLGDLDIILEEEEMIPITTATPPPPPPPPPQTTLIEIVEDDEDIEEELEIDDTESDENDIVEFIDIPEEAEDMTIFTIVEEEASFPGGQEELFRWLGKETKYPQIARDANITGVVYVQFVVERDGTINKELIEVLRGVHPALDAEAIRVVKAMPKWEPGRQRGKPVRQYFKLPLRFTLR